MTPHERKILSLDAPVPEGVTDAGTAPAAARVAELVAAGGPVLVTLAPDAGAAGTETAGAGAAGAGAAGAVPDPGVLAAASVYAWLGVRVFRAPEPYAPALRQVLDMVASIQGTRPPAVARRGLA